MWSSPWFPLWKNIHDHLKIQGNHFRYPAKVKDLWNANTKSWNTNVILQLFDNPTTDEILRTQILPGEGQDILCWKYSSAGICTAKEAYKYCARNLQASTPPVSIPSQVSSALMEIWKSNSLLPRIKTLAWRLIQNALPTGKISKHISKSCARCGGLEDEIHIFFLCPFTKAAWFAAPWFIRSECYANQHNSILNILMDISCSGHLNLSKTF